MRWIVVAALCLLAVPLTSAQTEPHWFYEAPDGWFDDALECVGVWRADLNGGCDLANFRTGLDGENLIMEVFVGGLGWPNAAHTVDYGVNFDDAEGNPYNMRFTVDFNGAITNIAGTTPAGMVCQSFPGTYGRISCSFAAATVGFTNETALELRDIYSSIGVAGVHDMGAGDRINIPGPIAMPPPPEPEVAEDNDTIPITTENVTGLLLFSPEFDNTTSIHVINWTSEFPATDLLTTWNLTAGNVTLFAVDGQNQTILNETLGGAGQSLPSLGLVENATLTITATNATGWMELQSKETPPPEEAEEVEQEVEEAEEELPVDAVDDQESPGLPVIVLLGALAIVAARRR